MKIYYQDKKTILYHGDCKAILPKIEINPLSSAIISDVPYGINAGFDRKGKRNSSLASRVNVSRNWGSITGDNQPFDPAWLLHFAIVALFGANHYLDRLPPNPRPNSWKWLMWDKRNGSPSDNNSDGEMIWTNQTGALRIHSQKWRGIVREGVENLSRSRNCILHKNQSS